MQTVSIEIEKVNQDFEELIPFGDVIFISKDVCVSNGASDLMEALELFQTKLKSKSRLICTWGDQGAAGIDQTGKKYRIPARKVERIVDSCGAGDTFIAAVIASFVKGEDFETSLENGTKLASHKLGQKGFKGLQL